MQCVTGTLWDYHEQGWLVIPTNIGWKMNGDNVMGAGLAEQAKYRFPDFPTWYGNVCRLLREDTPVLPYREGKLIAFPTKPLNPQFPWRSWSQDSDLELIRRSVSQLQALIPILSSPRKIFMPLVGCGNGKLSETDVLPILEEFLEKDKRVTLVRG